MNGGTVSPLIYKGLHGCVCVCVCVCTCVNWQSRLCLPDFNECMVYGACSQTCTNTEGSYVCSCVEGYLPQPDNRSCKAKNGKTWKLQPFVYFDHLADLANCIQNEC